MSYIFKKIKRYYDMIVQSITAFCYVQKQGDADLNEALLSKCENETTNMIILGQTVADDIMYHRFPQEEKLLYALHAQQAQQALQQAPFSLLQ